MLIVLLLILDGHIDIDNGLRLAISAAVLVIRISHHHHWTNTMMHAIITDASQLPIVPSFGGTESSAPHDHRVQPQPLHLQAQPLLHVMVLHYVDLVGDLRFPQRPRKIRRL